MVVIDIKRIITRAIFIGQVIIFVWVYLFGVHGFSYLRSLKQQCAQVHETIEQRQQELGQLQQEIIAWNVHSFYKEKMAREQLQMARKGETIYVFDTQEDEG